MPGGPRGLRAPPASSRSEWVSCSSPLLALTASWLSGVYGSVGMGGGIILALVAALALPYLVVLPCVELLCIGPRVGVVHRGDVAAGVSRRRAVMRGHSLARLLAAWALVTFVLCGLVRRTFTLDARGAPRAVVASAWKAGALLARAVVARPGEHDPRLDAALASLSSSDPDAALRYESVVAEGPVFAFAEVLLALSLVPGRDGLVATLGDRTEYLTPDDLLAHQAYRAGVRVPGVDSQRGRRRAARSRDPGRALLDDRSGLAPPSELAARALRATWPRALAGKDRRCGLRDGARSA